jgi:hypothetical protein
MRAPGLTWDRLPLFIWANYATSLIMILGTPVVAITIVLVAVERALPSRHLRSRLGGDPLLFQHLFWFYSHPAVYIMILPSMGVISELITCFSRKRIFGYKFIALSSIAIAVSDSWSGPPHVRGRHLALCRHDLFVPDFFIGVPSAVKVFNWTATLYKGSITYATPMLYAFGFIGLFTIGGLTGLFLAPSASTFTSPTLTLSSPTSTTSWWAACSWVSRRHAFLVAEDQRPHVSGRLGQAVGAARVRRLQPDVLPAVHSRLRRHAAPLLAVSAGVPGAERALHRGRQHTRRRLSAADDLLPLVAALREDRRDESLERRWPGVEDHVAAAHL